MTIDTKIGAGYLTIFTESTAVHFLMRPGFRSVWGYKENGPGLYEFALGPLFSVCWYGVGY